MVQFLGEFTKAEPAAPAPGGGKGQAARVEGRFVNGAVEWFTVEDLIQVCGVYCGCCVCGWGGRWFRFVCVWGCVDGGARIPYSTGDRQPTKTNRKSRRLNNTTHDNDDRHDMMAGVPCGELEGDQDVLARGEGAVV